jgi:DNA-binding beta-propeller fold protein YncE
VLPQLRELEHRFPQELAVIGVHSGKYHRERETDRIREASIRLGNTHPVVNDRQFRVWRSYAVQAWPTLVLLSPDGYVLATRPGEFTAAMLIPTIERLIAEYDRAGRIDRRTVATRPDVPARAPGILRYPGKVAVDGERFAVADTGHHRVLVGRVDPLRRTFRVERMIGDGVPSMRDGSGGALNAPQGLCFAGDTLYIADAGNHAIRAVALGTGELRTVAGTGQQLRTTADLRAGALSSPWDLTHAGQQLFIAMAGIHQLWTLDPATGRAQPHSGTRAEALVDGPNRDAVLAQPMGITSDEGRAYFVDAESSAVRWADLAPAGEVGTIVGTGLFDFGDRDGTGDEVRLEHPQGIARHPDGRLLVADSYSDALKWAEPATRRVTTWVRGLNEPAGVACGATHAFVADTNAHRIVSVAYADGRMEEVSIEV